MTEFVEFPADFAKAFEAALNAGALERILALYDENATILGQDGLIGEGRAAVRAEMSRLIAARARIDNRPRRTLVQDDTALIVVDWTLDLTAPDGDTVRHAGTATNVLRRRGDGGWRMIVANPLGAD